MSYTVMHSTVFCFCRCSYPQLRMSGSYDDLYVWCSPGFITYRQLQVVHVRISLHFVKPVFSISVIKVGHTSQTGVPFWKQKALCGDMWAQRHSYFKKILVQRSGTFSESTCLAAPPLPLCACNKSILGNIPSNTYNHQGKTKRNGCSGQARN